MEIISERLITDAEAKEILSLREKEGEMKYAQKNALEILNKFIERPTERLKTLLTELKKIEKLRERQVIALVNFLPMDKDDLRAVLHKDYNTFTEDEINLILETVKKFA